MNEPYAIAGLPEKGGTLIVVDHAANFVPTDVTLSIPLDFLDDHIAFDIGVAKVARQMTKTHGFLAYLATVSRLVVDLNRDSDELAVIPRRSDGVEIPGNAIDLVERQDRLDRYFHPYHDRLSDLIKELEPGLILSLHSFTPTLRTDRSVDRPWDIGVLYNKYEAASRFAIQFLEEQELRVGDQKPYSGKELNATMNRHAEANGLAYTGVEIRQDLITGSEGQTRFADILVRMCAKITSGLA